MKKLTALIGSSVETYRDEMKFFNKFERKFKCKVKKIGRFKFNTIVNKWKIDFLFCYVKLKYY